jgi:hypothetical protein
MFGFFGRLQRHQMETPLYYNKWQQTRNTKSSALLLTVNTLNVQREKERIKE